MKINTVISIIVGTLISIHAYSQSPDWTWVDIISGNDVDASRVVTTDHNNNCILGGYFSSDTLQIGTQNHIPVGSYDIFIVKYDTSGTVLWSKSLGGNGNEIIDDIIVDTNNNIYVVGRFQSNSLFLDSTFILNNSNTGHTDAFYAILDEYGNTIFAESFGSIGVGGTYLHSGPEIAIDNEGSYYIGGTFRADTLTIRDTVICSSGPNIKDFFLLKFSSSNELQWIKSSQYGNYMNRLNGLIISSDSCIYISGNFCGDSIILDNFPLYAYDQCGYFLAKYDLNGNLLFANNYGDYENYEPSCGYISADNYGNIIMAGNYWGDYLIFNSDTVFNAGEGQDMFICKFDSLGNPLWASGVGNFQRSDRANSVAVDFVDDIYVTGMFQTSQPSGDTVYFNDSIYLIIHMAGQYIAKYSADGSVLWAKTNSVPTVHLTEGTSITLDSQGNIYSTGVFTGTSITFGSQTYQSYGLFDSYLVKLEQSFLEQANTPAGQTEVCNSDTIEYITSNVMGASYYQWEVLPVEAGSIIGDSIVGTFCANATWSGNFSVRVRAMSSCCTGIWSDNLQCNMYIIPTQYFILGDGPYCEGESGSELLLEDSEIGIEYELYLDNTPTGIVTLGDGSSISFGYVTPEGIYTAMANSSANCGSLMWGDVWVYQIDLPNKPNIPMGSTQVCNNDSSNYSSLGSNNADTLLWILNPSEAGEIVSYEDSIIIYWNNDFYGLAYLTCQGMNNCGLGPASDSIEIYVVDSPTPSISGLDLVCQSSVTEYETEGTVGNLYSWNVLGGEVIIGTGTNIVTILWGNPGTGYISLLETNSEGCQEQTEDFIVSIDECLIVDDNRKSAFNIFPNPTKGWISINGESNINSIAILNITGHIIMTMDNLKENNIDCNLSGLKNGIYCIKIRYDSLDEFHRIVKL